MRVLFVCVENSCRSQMAEAFMRMLGGANYSAESAGSNPSGVVNPKAVEAMAECGYDLTQHHSKSVAEFSTPFDYVITMGCGDRCPVGLGKKTLDWELPDPKNMEMAEFRGVRDAIKEKVASLIATTG